MPEKHSVIDLIEIIVEFGRKQQRIVILEGIFACKKYKTMLICLIEKFDESYVYYFDLPFEKTLHRHATKPNNHEFGKELMREWRNEKDYLGIPGETILGPELSMGSIVDKIVDDVNVA
ncbi:MAG: kinase [Candidatus Saccharimonas sp.]|nr:kinase [Candidatus Saccharimonas sp.]